MIMCTGEGREEEEVIEEVVMKGRGGVRYTMWMIITMNKWMESGMNSGGMYF